MVFDRKWHAGGPDHLATRDEVDKKIDTDVSAGLGDPVSPISLALAATLSNAGSPARLALDPVLAAAYASRSTSFVPLLSALDDGVRSIGVQVLSDSTGNATDEWPYEVAQALATAHPAWTVRHMLWNDATQAFFAPTTIQTGTAGAQSVSGATGKQTRRLSAAQSPHISGAIDVRVKMAMSDWTPAALHVFTGKTDLAGSRSWYAGINNTASGNRPYFVFSTDGTALTTMTVIGTPSVSDGATLWMRWLFTPDDGASNRTLAAFQSADGVTWTQIGATVTTAGAVAVFNASTVGYSLGGEGAGTNAPGATIYEVQIRAGAAGPDVVPRHPDLWTPNPVATVDTVPVVGAPILTVVNASHPGASVAYWSDATRLPLACPKVGQAVSLISLGHNQTFDFGTGFLASFDALRVATEARLVGVPTVLVTQNPEKVAYVTAKEHATRCTQLRAYAKQRGLGLIDVFPAFPAASPTWEATLMLDDLHPNAAGQDVWRDTVLNHMGPL